jgi:thiol-disulfide isomerase/thioredoxin
MRGMRRPALGIVLLALLAGLGGLGAWIHAYGPPPRLLHLLMSTRLGDRIAQDLLRDSAPAAPPGVAVRGPGDALPPWTMPDAVDGRPRSLAQWQGKRTVLVFWATWCVPCLKEMPALAAAQRTHAGRGVQIVGIAMDEPDRVRDFLHTHPPAYPMLLGGNVHPDPRVALGDTRRALPFSVLVDRRGRIVRTRLGGLDPATLARWLQ